MTSLQFAPSHVFFSGVVPAWAPSLPDHRWLDSDQQYHFVKVHVLCNYNYAEAIIAVSYTHLRAHETDSYLVCRLLLEKKQTRYNCNSWTSSTTVSWTWGRERLMRMTFYSEKRWMSTPRESYFRLSRVRGRDDRGNGAEKAGKRAAVKQKQ